MEVSRGKRLSVANLQALQSAKARGEEGGGRDALPVPGIKVA